MLVIGTPGHIDHGKSTLVQALTGINPDRLREERERGMTIDLGFAWLRLPGIEGEVSIVDVPGHERFIKNMLAGVGGIDLALLVIAADEGVMPQTREHLAILDLLDVRSDVVAITKIDLVEPDWLELVQADIEETLAGTTLAEAPLVPVSAVTGAGLDELRQTLAERPCLYDRGLRHCGHRHADRWHVDRRPGGCHRAGRAARAHSRPAGTQAARRAGATRQQNSGEPRWRLARRSAARHGPLRAERPSTNDRRRCASDRGARPCAATAAQHRGHVPYRCGRGFRPRAPARCRCARSGAERLGTDQALHAGGGGARRSLRTALAERDARRWHDRRYRATSAPPQTRADARHAGRAGPGRARGSPARGPRPGRTGRPRHAGSPLRRHGGRYARAARPARC